MRFLNLWLRIALDWLHDCCHLSHAGNLDRFLGRKNMLTHMLAHPYAIGGFSYAGIWAFYGLTQGLRESKSPQSHLFS